MKRQHINEIKAIVIFAIALLIFASLISFHKEDLPFYTSHPNNPPKNLVRIFGAYLAGGTFFLIGWSGYIIVFLLLYWSINKFLSRETGIRFSKIFFIAVLFLALSAFFSTLGSQEASQKFLRGGILGSVSSDFLVKYCGLVGTYIILAVLSILSFIITAEVLVSPFVLRFFDRLSSFFGNLKAPKISLPQRREKKEVLLKPKPKVLPTPAQPLQAKPIAPPKIDIRQPKSQPVIKEAVSKVKPVEEKERFIGEYNLPSLDLLDNPPPLSTRQIKEDLMENARVLEETLNDFGVSVRIADIERGPVITRYELEPAPGVKVNKIVSLSDDIALAMKAPTVRIVAPIPGKNRVGVEVPNTQSSIVYLKEVFSTDDFRKFGSKLVLALGKDTAGKPLISDLGELPHLLIAGATGSGKTVCVNSIIMSMLYSATPQEVKFMMIDPKMVELAPFNGLPHLLCPVITDHKKVSSALNWVVNEMEERYTLLAQAGVRNIEGYNDKKEKLPYIVVIIDELADLMVVAAAQIENAITRLAQLSRAVGIHLILATQRPSVDVITGVIKANFPARISFKVASKVDSRTVLDMNGADKLVGKGDMLFLKPGEAKPIRAQGSLIQDKEIERVVEFIRSQQEPFYDEDLIKEQEKKAMHMDLEKDELFDEAVKLILESNQASVSVLQRRMRLGYTRAARIIDMMEQEGIVGPFRGSKPREILVDKDAWLAKDNPQK
ncbi:MAG: DNA translocase FtsK [Candidatus Omnitrophica bacterium]|nr:DNA translocase FtsK [Candidatus Omnitrophota bacterium]